MWILRAIVKITLFLLMIVVPIVFVFYIAIAVLSTEGRQSIRKRPIFHWVWGLAAAACVFWFLRPIMPDPPPINQQQDLVSPGSNFVLSVPIEISTPNREGKQYHVWKVTIRDLGGTVRYKDEDSQMTGILNVYWGWDAESRVWLYNSDDGQVWRWHLEDGTWREKKMDNEDGMPDWILPEYARKIREENKAEPQRRDEPSFTVVPEGRSR